MAVKTYNKLVRDKIPDIIAKQGKSVTFHIVKGEDLKEALNSKLFEEVRELINAETEEQIIEEMEEQIIEEMVDVMEVLYAIKDMYGISESDLDDRRFEKIDEKGGLREGYFLESVSD